jgi:methylase of polypeptide subunit release factors
LCIAEANLLKDGFLALEIHENFAKESFALFNRPSFQNVKIYRDLQGKERILIAQKV